MQSSQKVSWTILSIIVLASLVSGAAKPDKRSKPLALNLDVIKAQDEDNNIKETVDTKSDSDPSDTKVVATPIVVKPKNSTENINETIEETFQLLDTLEKDDETVKGTTTVVPKPRPSEAFIGQIKNLLLNFVRLFGFVPTSNKRKHRNMNYLNETENAIESSDFYREQIRTTLGAALGRPDCIKRAACRAGKYLKGIKGKEIILVIMEKVTPTKWQETYRVVKDSAVHSNECQYKCLED